LSNPFEILFIIYPDFNSLDFAGPFEMFFRIPNVKITLASPSGGNVTSEAGLVIGGTEKLANIERCDLLCIPGGMHQDTMLTPEAIADIRRVAGTATYITSVCNGSLILAQAGLLVGRRSACHWSLRHLLSNYGAIPDDARVVRDGNYFSGGGVTSGIDFALTVAAEIFGENVAQAQQLITEYAPQPPFNAGRPETAGPEVLAEFDHLFGDALRGIGARVPTV
jgi:transcriptional regulator GlxA family with amidase domain